MRAMRYMMVLLLGAASILVRAESIGDVLERSQRKRLDELSQPATDSSRASKVRASFERLIAELDVRAAIELRVVAGPVIAETLLGRVIVVNQALADTSEGERLFVLAHEIGHAVHGHWHHLGELYRRHIPGEVRREQTDAVAGVLGREASMQAHAHELQADAFAIRALEHLHYGADEAMAVFMRQGVQHDTATHPGTRKRVAQLRMLTAAK
jgi:Zn-dependent protease with chaperone function